MSRYIDADALVTDISFFDGENFHYGYSQGTIESAPTVDAVPVEWIENYVKWLRKREIQFAPVAIENMLSYYKDLQPYCDSCGERKDGEHEQ